MKANTGGENSKHNVWHERIHEALQVIDIYQLQLVGTHWFGYRL